MRLNRKEQTQSKGAIYLFDLADIVEKIADHITLNTILQPRGPDLEWVDDHYRTMEEIALWWIMTTCGHQRNIRFKHKESLTPSIATQIELALIPIELSMELWHNTTHIPEAEHQVAEADLQSGVFIVRYSESL